ncbi:hypothetical protein DM01DRAFT_345473 [Hesseltinella vesiculosa]|uniref:Uncharacterized protein n=1 Tax=Hesseltinella vesiculosa TaxID=101127 RepID=A0A1X2GLS4_9FUNG|nr:hypothetical protein DM01DRAFT_345473 [Hesseltinella vesiculosa]
MTNLMAPPPSPQDPCPLDDLFAQHLSTKLHQIPMETANDNEPWSRLLNLDTSMPPIQSPINVPRSLPLSSTSTYHHKQHAGVDPHQLDLLLRNVSNHKHKHYNAHVGHRRRSWQLHTVSGKPALRKKHIKPSRIPVFSRRLKNQIPPIDHTQPSSSSTSPTSYHQLALQQKSRAISTVVEKWKRLKQQQQQTNASQQELDMIVKDLRDMGLS